MAARASASDTPPAGSSSSTIAMSDPRRSWMSAASSGVSRCWAPSRWERNLTPCSVTCPNVAKLKI